ncbi:MAG: substrate-binding domain-containing protein, partial [Myxococcales bacterium]|nr:substrate-binding domain-containing protein [Myxococcales bacterium]
MSEAPASPSPTPGERDLGRSSRGASVLGWSLALAGSALLMVAGLFLVRWVEQGPTPPYLQGDGLEAPGKAAVHERAPKPGNLLRLAGSGSNLPLTRALADAFVATRPWLRIRVHESIGSGGGIKAIDDQVIEIGLASRPLKEREQQLGLVAVPYARVAVVVAANPSVPVRSVAREELLDYWGKRRTHWDDGSPVVVLQREPGDSSHLAAAKAIPGF